MSWPTDKANANWQALGGDKEFPKCGGKTCQMDHIVELQLGGNNSNENMQALDQKQNGDSGSAVRAHVSALAKKIQTTKELTDGHAQQIQLRFTQVEFKGTEAFRSSKPSIRALTPASASSSARAIPRIRSAAALPKVERDERPMTLDEMTISAGGQRTALQVPQGFLKDKNAAPVLIAKGLDKQVCVDADPRTDPR